MSETSLRLCCVLNRQLYGIKFLYSHWNTAMVILVPSVCWKWNLVTFKDLCYSLMMHSQRCFRHSIRACNVRCTSSSICVVLGSSTYHAVHCYPCCNSDQEVAVSEWKFDSHVRWFKVNLESFFPEDVGTSKIKHFCGQLVATLHSLPGRWPYFCALDLRVIWGDVKPCHS
jgi:hypothetical protein